MHAMGQLDEGSAPWLCVQGAQQDCHRPVLQQHAHWAALARISNHLLSIVLCVSVIMTPGRAQGPKSPYLAHWDQMIPTSLVLRREFAACLPSGVLQWKRIMV